MISKKLTIESSDVLTDVLRRSGFSWWPAHPCFLFQHMT